MTDFITGDDGKKRCGWCGHDPLYTRYHDEEWGKPAFDDARQFEFLVLESAQAGLAWITILRKRETYREAYHNFNPEKVASWTEKDVEKLLGNAGIIRNRRKIEASINNARYFLELSERHGSFGSWVLNFLDGAPLVNSRRTMAEVPATTKLSDTISGEMKKIGFRFFGSTICYAHLQATGFVNDHLNGCCLKN